MPLARLAERSFALVVALAAVALVTNAVATAQSVDRPASRRAADVPGEDDAKTKKSEEPPKPSVTHHTATIDGREIKYTATAGKMLLATDEGDPKAYVFYVAYTVDDPNAPRGAVSRDAAAERDDEEDESDEASDDDEDEDSDDEDDEDDEDGEDEDDDEDNDATAAAPATPNRRPITFCFNGGPGSSSVWLHLGMLGPVRVKLDSNAGTLPPPHQLIPNPYSLLDKTDLVFIDPVSTGFSRPAEGEDRRQFHGYEQDIRAVGQFIHDYTTKNARWASPKFVLGESYGGIRSAGLSGELRDRYHLELNGIVLISAVVDFQTLAARGNNDIAYALFLPSFAATAWYHKALDDDLLEDSLESVVRDAEEFAIGPYLQALAAGDALPENRRRRIIRQMSELTGLSEDYIDRANLRVSQPRFGKELLRDRRKVVGRYDSRYTGFDRDTLGEMTEHDPSGEAVFGTFTSALNDYLRTQLKVDETRVYEILTGNVQPWDYGSFANRYVSASDTLREAMTANPYLKVFAACGHYDLATPQYAMQYTRDHLGLEPERRDNFTLDFYEAGHMMYVHEPSLVKLRKDLLKFYDEALPKAETDGGGAGQDGEDEDDG
jgi:carboxypeptidase C (cathepsin A)